VEPPVTEIESLAAFEQHLADGRSLARVVFQGVDLMAHGEVLLRSDLSGTVFLGCLLEPTTLPKVIERGAMVFPPFTGLPYSPYRGSLYTPEELYAGFDAAHPESYADTPDARVYAHWSASGGAHPPSILETLAQRLHDHAISDALEEALVRQGQPRRVVAIMGGHSMQRGREDYRAVATLARELARLGFFLVSGGGPGAMEATHLGAWFAGRSEGELDEALAVLARAPGYTHREWLARAFEVRAQWPLLEEHRGISDSLGIPTWLYGHEPPNPFATRIAKYFANSVREDGLLTIARGGVVYSPGSAGTVQEIFQDACQNHYNTVGVISPMIFLGRDFWTRTRPVYPLLEHLARGQEYARHLLLTDSREEIIQALVRFDREQDTRRSTG
jgi:predicted Rossmann-fold nucleotide-binding protein